MDIKKSSLIWDILLLDYKKNKSSIFKFKYAFVVNGFVISKHKNKIKSNRFWCKIAFESFEPVYFSNLELSNNELSYEHFNLYYPVSVLFLELHNGVYKCYPFNYWFYVLHISKIFYSNLGIFNLYDIYSEYKTLKKFYEQSNFFKKKKKILQSLYFNLFFNYHKKKINFRINNIKNILNVVNVYKKKFVSTFSMFSILLKKLYIHYSKRKKRIEFKSRNNFKKKKINKINFNRINYLKNDWNKRLKINYEKSSRNKKI